MALPAIPLVLKAGAIAAKPAAVLGAKAIGVIKTTSAIGGATAATAATAGGKIFTTATAATAAGITGVGKIGGAMIVPSAVIGGLAYGGTRLYDYIGDVGAKTQSLREYDMALTLAEREGGLIDARREKELEFNQRFLEQQKIQQEEFGSMNIPSEYLAAGGNYLPIWNMIERDQSSQAEIEAQASVAQTRTLMFGMLGVALIGGGAYYFTQK